MLDLSSNKLTEPILTHPAVTDLNPDDCSNGTFVFEPSAKPDLVADCRALVAVRNHWTRHPDNASLPARHPLLTWGRGDTIEIVYWKGIKISEGRITYLALTHASLAGPFPPELGQLTKLYRLYLSNNQLTGPIPETNRLTNLIHLDLSSNKLTGPIPTEISQLTNLGILFLHNNQLTGPIPEINQLTNLKELWLDSNKLTGPIPTEISQLTNLQHLELSCNDLTGPIPSELIRLSNFSRLYLDGNHLTGTVPPELEDRVWPAFCDDENSSHGWAIQNIARWGITHGCGNDNFCPGDPITRSQMAAFLHRAVTRQSGRPVPVTGPTLVDLEKGAWYRRYAEWAVAAGVMRAPNGKFDPGGVVTRADMAEMLTSTLEFITPSAAVQGYFTDMTDQPDRVVRAAEALRTAEITKGCSDNPLRYCPNQPVTRAQMASFFYRALTHHPPGADFGPDQYHP